MKKLEVFKKLREAIADPARAGDVALYKSELVGMRARPAVEARLSALPATVPDVDLARLSALPRGTLGREYAELLAGAGLRPFRISAHLEPEVVARNRFTARYALVHDVFHVLTGFDTSWAGEAGVWAFVAAQGYARVHWIALMLACLLYPIVAPRQAWAVWRNVRRGLRMGRRARSILAEPFEHHWATTVATLRSRLRIEPATAATEGAGVIVQRWERGVSSSSSHS